MTKKHLVLGGSQGIGFAYAAKMATRHDHLTLVARRPAMLGDAKARLLREGAASVRTLNGDLLDHGFRTNLKNQCAGFDSILASGPSPAIGGLEITAKANWETVSLQGCRVCLVYPVDVLEWALGAGLADHGRLILISSASVEEPLADTPFLLSRLFRVGLHELIPLFESRYKAASKALHVWKPEVVLTPLSIEFATKIVGHEISEQEAQNILLNHLGGAEIRTAGDYVSYELGRMENDRS